MARRAFFSFHYDRDIWRATIVRNSWLTQEREAAGFFDASLWEEAKKQSDAAIKALIDTALLNTSVTVVLIGAETSGRPYVQYEIDKSIGRGNGLLGVRIHNIKDSQKNTDAWGANPLPAGYTVYDYVTDNGYANLGSWIETAATAAGK